MIADQGRLAPAERRAMIAGPLYRIVGMPVIALLGLANTGIVVRETGEQVFGLVSLIATVPLLIPFVDLGIGATVLTAAAQLSEPEKRSYAVDVIRRAYRVLFTVAAVVILLALTVTAADRWETLVGFSAGGSDRWAIGAAVCVFAMTIPAGLGVRILIGVDRNASATIVLMSCPAFALGVTLVLYQAGAADIWYALSSLSGLLIGLTVGTVAALRISGLGWSVFAPVSVQRSRSALLAGSGWLFLMGVGLPVGLQTGRVLLAHLSTPVELSDYALMAQIYAAVWSVLSAAGLAFWPVFVKRRSAPEHTLRLWRRATGVFAAIAVGGALALSLGGPWAAQILSGGTITISTALAAAFGILLVGQAIHLPATVLLTRPTEARWQALWTIAMAAISIGLGGVVAERFGAAGVVCAAATGIIAAQALPALLWAPTLVRRRPDVAE